MSAMSVPAANMRLVRASPRARRAMAAGFTRPFRGCSPMEVAAPVSPVWVWAITATSATGNCSGPQHCCCATSPATRLAVTSHTLLPGSIEPCAGLLSDGKVAAPISPVCAIAASPTCSWHCPAHCYCTIRSAASHDAFLCTFQAMLVGRRHGESDHAAHPERQAADI